MTHPYGNADSNHIDGEAEAAPLETPCRHAIVNLEGGRWLIDTGASFSFGRGPVSICGRRFEVPERMPDAPVAIGLDALAPFVGCRLDGLFGMDILRQFSLVLDAPRAQARFGGEALDAMPGLRVPLEMRMQAPLLEAEIEGRSARLFWDTGAMISYLSAGALSGAWPLHGRAKDFHPLLGVFETDLCAAHLRIAGHRLMLTFGRLPDPLAEMLIMTGAQGVLGNELLNQFTVGFDPFRHTLILQ